MKILFFSILLIISVCLFPQKLAELSIRENKESNTEYKSRKFIVDIVEESTKPEEIKEEVLPKTEQSTITTVEWWKYPDDIKTVTRSGDDLLVLVNKEYRLPSIYAPKDLVKASNSGIRRGENYYLRSILINDLSDMVKAAEADSIDLSIVSGYRSYITQENTYNYWLSKNNYNVDYVDTFSARAGHSQHQLGTAVDFSTDEINDTLGDSFVDTKAGKWLATNAYKYGFVISFPKGYESITRYKYESWHYRYIGKTNALEMTTSNQILEVFLKSKNQ